MQIALKAANWVMTGAVVVLLLALIAWFAAPRLLGYEPQVVLSGSMKPALPVGSVVFVKPVPVAQITVGDIITFRHARPEANEILVTHRVTEILIPGDASNDSTEFAFRTKGDANGDVDNWIVPAANVEGTVRFSVPYMGYVTDRVRTPEGFLVLIGLPALLIVIGEVRSIVAELRKPRGGRNEGTHRGLGELAADPEEPVS